MAIIGLGATIGYRAVGSSDSFSELAHVKAVGAPMRKMGKADITAHDSPADGAGNVAKEYIAGLLYDVEDLPITLLFEADDYETLDGLFGQLNEWQLSYSDGSTETFNGFVSEIGNSIELENKAVETSIKLCVAGVIAFDAGSSS